MLLMIISHLPHRTVNRSVLTVHHLKMILNSIKFMIFTLSVVLQLDLVLLSHLALKGLRCPSYLLVKMIIQKTWVVDL